MEYGLKANALSEDTTDDSRGPSLTSTNMEGEKGRDENEEGEKGDEDARGVAWEEETKEEATGFERNSGGDDEEERGFEHKSGGDEEVEGEENRGTQGEELRFRGDSTL